MPPKGLVLKNLNEVFGTHKNKTVFLGTTFKSDQGLLSLRRDLNPRPADLMASFS